MKKSAKIAISLLSLAAVPFINGCSSKTDEVKRTTVAYVPPSTQETVVVQPAPVIAPLPSTVTTTEERSSENSSDIGNNATRESASAYHSETSTVTPMTAPSQEATTTTVEKKTYQATN